MGRLNTGRLPLHSLRKQRCSGPAGQHNRTHVHQQPADNREPGRRYILEVRGVKFLSDCTPNTTHWHSRSLLMPGYLSCSSIPVATNTCSVSVSTPRWTPNICLGPLSVNALKIKSLLPCPGVLYKASGCLDIHSRVLRTAHNGFEASRCCGQIRLMAH